MNQVPKLFVGAFCALSPLLCQLSFGLEFQSTASETSLEISRRSPEQTTIALHSPVVRTVNTVQGYEVLQSFMMDGETLVPEEGRPTVPQVFRLCRIPETGSAELVVTEADYDVIENVHTLPYQLDSAMGRTPALDEEFYRQDVWYPPQVAAMTSPMILRDFRVVGVTLYPVQVNPVTHQARVYRNLAVDLVANSEPGVNEITQPRRPSGEWAPLYRDHISNLDDHALDDMTRTPGSILIVTTSAIPHPWVDSLFEWKTRKGFKVAIEARATWSSFSVVDAIQTAYRNLDPPLEYVILIGDPASVWNVPTSLTDFDHLYALGNDGDHLEDIAVGRLSGSTSAEMATIHAKIMQYERTPHMTNAQGAADTTWYHEAFLYAGISHSCAGNYLLMRWGQQQFLQHTGVDSTILLTHATDVINFSQTLAALNSGVGYFLWRGTWIGDMPNYLPAQMNPTGRLPITMTMECATGSFESAGASCISEAFLCAGTPASPKGGVCGIGMATAGSYNPANVTLTGGFIYNIANLGVEHLGTALVGAKSELVRAYPGIGDSNFVNNHMRWCNLMGDPSLAIWTDVPHPMQVVHRANLEVGTRSVEVGVFHDNGQPLADALVVLWKRSPDSTWISGLTDSQGHITLPAVINEFGNLYLTVTKRNYIPYLYTIPCDRREVMLMASSFSFDDDQSGGTEGNGNGLLNPGETIDLPMYIQNYGDATRAVTVSADLTSPNPRISIIRGTAGYPTLEPGDSALSAVPFRIHIAPDLPNLAQTLLTLTINSSAGQYIGCIPVICHAGELHYVRKYSDEFEPGGMVNIIVVVRNTGAEIRHGVTGHLVSLCPWLAVPDAEGVFGDIPAEAADSNQTDVFTLHSNALMVRGQTADMRLILTGSDGSADTVQFPITVGIRSEMDPCGPDSFGYFAYDNTDSTYDIRPEFNYIDAADNGGMNLNLLDPGDKTIPLPIYSTVQRLPFGFKFYDQVYDSITICSNGWCAFGDQSSVDMFRNYPIPGQGAPDAMIAPYWDDLATLGTNRGVWIQSDTANHQFIIQWKAGVGMNFATPLDFEVILFDTTYFPTDDGNGRILFQYNQVTMNVQNAHYEESSGSTVGIQAPGCRLGLNYVYQSDYAPGAAEIESGSSILFTTSARQGLTSVQGQITDAATLMPIPGAQIRIDNIDTVIIAGDDGTYRYDPLATGEHTIHVQAHRYNEVNVDVTVALEPTNIVNVSLLHPEMSLPADSLHFTLGAQIIDTNITVENLGNGPLDCSPYWNPAELATRQPWDELDSIRLNGLVGGRVVQGCEFADGRWWIAAGGLSGHSNYLYRLDSHGGLLDSLIQPSTTTMGWTDLAYDGHFVYGSDGANIIGLDMSGVERTRITSVLNPTRALTYDAVTDHFWVANETSNILELDRGGNLIRTLTRTQADSMLITGLAWFPRDGFDLYVYGRGTGNTGSGLVRLNPTSGERQSIPNFESPAGGLSGGCTITGRWSTMEIVFAGISQNANGGQLNLYYVTMNPQLIQLSPTLLTIPAHETAQLSLRLNPNLMRPATYRFNVYLHSTIEDTTLALPVDMRILDLTAGDQTPSALPKRFILHQNFPNPFNPTTEIAYELPEAARVELTVFNLLGQKIIMLDDGVHPAGSFHVIWDGRDATGLPAANGMYIYQLTAGNYSSAMKMLLLK